MTGTSNFHGEPGEKVKAHRNVLEGEVAVALAA